MTTTTTTTTDYAALGIRPVINASATLTRLGGSLMPGSVLDAMRSGAGSFVDLVELQTAVGARIAEFDAQRGVLRVLRSGGGHGHRPGGVHGRQRQRADHVAAAAVGRAGRK